MASASVYHLPKSSSVIGCTNVTDDRRIADAISRTSANKCSNRIVIAALLPHRSGIGIYLNVQSEPKLKIAKAMILLYVFS